MATDGSEEGPPTFFKVVRYPSAPHLVLPTAFVKRYLEKIPKRPIVKTATGEKSWRLKMKKIGEDYCFCNGWEKLAKDAQLSIRDIVFLSLIDAFTFEVSFFDANGCEKELPLNNTNFSGDNEDEVTPQEEDDGDEVVPHEEDDGVEVMEDEENVGVEVMPDEEDDGVEVMADEEGDGDEVMPNENLCFQKVISEKSHRYTMLLPKKFVEAAGLENKSGITMKDHEGKEWIMGMMADKNHNTRSLSSGWSLFRQYYKLSEGDICLFKFIKKDGVLILAQVLKNNRPRRQEIGNRKETVTNVEGVKRKRGRPRLEKPQNGCGGGGGGGVKVKIENELGPVAEVVKRKRGRPPLQKHGGGGGGGVDVKVEDQLGPVVEVVKRKRGRPRVEKHGGGGCGGGGVYVKVEDQSGPEVEVVKRKRGRPRVEKHGGGGSGGGVKVEDGLEAEVEAVKRKRGRPRVEKDGGFGGGVKIKIEDADGSVVERKRGSPAAVEKGGVEVKTEVEEAVAVKPRERERPSLDRSHRVVIYF